MKAAILLVALWLAGCGSSARTPEQLVAGLDGPDAVNCFAELRQREDARSAIVAGTRSASPRVRGQCARLLGIFRELDGVAALRPLLHDPNREVRSQAARALVPLVETSELVGWLRSGALHGEAQWALVRALLRDPTEFMEPEFVDWLRQPGRDVAWRLRLYQSMLEFHSPGFGRSRRERPLLADVQAGRQKVAATVRRDALDAATPEELRLLAIPLYASLGGAASWPDVRQLVERCPPGSALHLRALQAAGMTRSSEAVSLLAAALRQPDPRYQKAALSGLAHVINRPGALDLVLPFLQNPAPELRYVAAEALAGSRDGRAEEALRQRLGSESEPRLRRRVSASLRSVRSLLRQNRDGEEAPGAGREQPTS